MTMDTGIPVSSEYKYFPPVSPLSPQISVCSNEFYFSGDLNRTFLPVQLYQNGFSDLTPVPAMTNVRADPFVQNPVMNLKQNPKLQSDSSEDPLMFSDIDLNYISQMLLEEDIIDKFEQYPETPALLAEEERFREILQSDSVPSPDQPPLPSINSSESPDDSFVDSLINYECNCYDNIPLLDNANSVSFDLDQFFSLEANLNTVSADYSSSPSVSSSNSSNNALDVLDIYNELQNQPIWQFNKGVEEAGKFLPNGDKLIIDLDANRTCSTPPAKIRSEKETEIAKEKEKQKKRAGEREREREKEKECTAHRGKKHMYTEDACDSEETRVNKQSAGNPIEVLLAHDMLDKVLLCDGETCSKGVKELRAALQSETGKHCNHSKSNGHTKGRRNRQSKKDVVDLTTLLSYCSQAVATDDRRCAADLLKQLRQHSSVKGDADQRMAHYFADGLEARLAGTGSQIYQSFIMKPIASTDILKAYQLYLAASPFKKISHFFSNQTTLDAAQKATAVHIIDYGIYHGFQWPCLIQRLSKRSGGPPKLRITGIDLPQSGFRPAERIEETGVRLADYAQRFNVPFEFKAIAKRWESVRVEELEIRKDELLVVNSLYRFKTLMDESMVAESPRDTVLKTIREMNPDVYIHGVVNGSYNTPFFVTRFREALFHFSALFDMLETNVPKDDPHRQLLEKELFGREAINVISCEGLERVERPETYKQWQVRNIRAGFKQLPLNPEIMKAAREKVQSCYYKDFVIDEDNKWLLQGWKGRILFALSTWRPSHRVK
jgi:GRAS domain family